MLVLTFAALYFVGFSLMVVGLAKAQEAHEDRSGFHFDLPARR